MTRPGSATGRPVAVALERQFVSTDVRAACERVVIVAGGHIRGIGTAAELCAVRDDETLEELFLRMVQ